MEPLADNPESDSCNVKKLQDYIVQLKSQICDYEKDIEDINQKLKLSEEQVLKSNVYCEELRQQVDKLHAEIQLLKKLKVKVNVAVQTDESLDVPTSSSLKNQIKSSGEEENVAAVECHPEEPVPESAPVPAAETREVEIKVAGSGAVKAAIEGEQGQNVHHKQESDTMVCNKHVPDKSTADPDKVKADPDKVKADPNKVKANPDEVKANPNENTANPDQNKPDHPDEEEGPSGSQPSLSDELRAAAESVVQQSGYVYDQNSGMYYDHNSGYYYSQEKGLFYDPRSGTYFFYNSEKGEYEFHSQVDLSQTTTGHHGYWQQYQYHNPSSHHHHHGYHSNHYGHHRHYRQYDRHGSDHRESSRDRYSDHRHSSDRERDRDRYRRGHDPEYSPDRRSHRWHDYYDYDFTDGEGSSHSRRNRDRDKDRKQRKNKKSPERADSKEMVVEDFDAISEKLASLNLTPAKQSAIDFGSGAWPPCIRVIVMDSNVLDPGSLIIVTCSGATVGREKGQGHIICIPDLSVSKHHATICYDQANKVYTIQDVGSQNGTFVNEERMSQTKTASEAVTLSHADIVQFGCTRLLLHIHPGLDTCDECEPGLVQAQLQAQGSPAKEYVIMSKEEKMKQQKHQLKQIKKKYGLQNAAYEDGSQAVLRKGGYEDKAAERRRTKGSDNPYQKDEEGASVHVPIGNQNKGKKLLQKMGWTEGESLGKHNSGIQEPISVTVRSNAGAGLGSLGAGEGSMADLQSLQRSQKWMKAKQRFADSDTGTVKHGATATKSAAKEWVQGETEHQ